MRGIGCGSQVVLCEYPIHIDTYRGCSHGCKYCFAQAKQEFANIKPYNCVQQLKNFISGKRTLITKWCDWDIPLHWGGLSDPFQPAELKFEASLACLKIFAETGYPVIISTKGKLIIEEPYISLLHESNVVVQVSMVCESYDRIEKGAPAFSERLKMLEVLSKNCKRVIVRAQPYITDVRDEFIANIPKFAEAGAYGITVEGIKYKRKKPGTIKVGGDYCYPGNLLESHYTEISGACKASNIAFFCAENRLRHLGDSTACCGCGDIDGFTGNKYNLVTCRYDKSIQPTERMMQVGTGGCFKVFMQDTARGRKLKGESFASMMLARSKVMDY